MATLNDLVRTHGLSADSDKLCPSRCGAFLIAPREGANAIDYDTATSVADMVRRKRHDRVIHMRGILRGRWYDIGRAVTSGIEFGLEHWDGPDTDTFENEYEEIVVCVFQPVSMPLSKEDLMQLARTHKLPFTSPALWAKNVAALCSELGLPVSVTDKNSVAQLMGNYTQHSASVLCAQDEASVAKIRLLRGQMEEELSSGVGRVTVAMLQERMAAEGLSRSAGMTRGGMLDALAWERLHPRMQLPGFSDLDEYQREAIDLGVRMLRRACGCCAASAEGDAKGDTTVPDELAISAGPGSGKTTTLTNFLAAAMRAVPEARIMVLVFNVEAERVLLERLRRILRGQRAGQAQLIPKGQVLRPEMKGCAVLTFDKMAYQICNHVGQEDIMSMMGLGGGSGAGKSAQLQPSSSGGSSFRDGKERAAERLRTSPHTFACFDMIVVDEGQDVTLLEEGIINGLCAARRSPRPALISSGDPRQEVCSGATWFSGVWTRAREATEGGAAAPAGGPTIRSLVLARNYRSHPHIVEALNAYSRAAFPTLHHDQISARADCDEGARAVTIAQVAPGADHVATNQEVGKHVAEFLSKAPVGAGYAIVPVTLDKFRMGPATAAARQLMHEHRPGELTVALTGDTKIPSGEVDILATARKIKGTERPRAAVYGIDRDYDIMVDNSIMAKLVYVALSRARDELMVVTQTLADQRIKELMGPFVAAVEKIDKRLGRESGASGAVTAAPVRGGGRIECRPVPVTSGSLAKNSAGMGVADIPYADNSRPWTETQPDSALPPLEDMQATRFDHDFVGRLAEAHLAAGMQRAWSAATGRNPDKPALANPSCIEVEPVDDREKVGLFFRDDNGELRQVLCVLRGAHRQITALLASVNVESAGFLAPYTHAMLKFSAECGRPWTVSESHAAEDSLRKVGQSATIAGGRLLQVAADCMGIEPGHVEEPEFWRYGAAPMPACREDPPGCIPDDRPKTGVDGSVLYETDAVVRNGDHPPVVIEFKYVTELQDKHKRQTYAYMALTGASHGVLYNGRTGETVVLRAHMSARCREVVSGMLYNECTGEIVLERTRRPVESSSLCRELVCRARALIAQRTARAVFLQHLERHALRPPAVMCGCTTAIVVDTENTDPVLRGGATTEIGAVAISLTDHSILGTFQRHIGSAVPLPTSEECPDPIENVTRLRVKGPWHTICTQSIALEREFHSWVSSMTSVAPLYVHWAGSERDLVSRSNFPGAPTLDVYRSCFMPWLDHKAAGRGRKDHTSLGDAMAQLAPMIPFAPHQAFEDALATMAVLLMTVSFVGAR